MSASARSRHPAPGEPAPQLGDPCDVWQLLLHDVRYALHRMSSAPTTAQHHVLTYRGGLTTQQLRQIRDEVATEIRIAENGGRLVGMRCDHDGWRAFVATLDGVLARLEAA